MLKEIITNIYSSFVFAEIFINFRNHFEFFCRSVIHYSINISWLNSDHSTAKYFNSFHSNRNFSKYFLCIDCYKKRITYHRRCDCKLLQSHIFAFISRNKMYFSFRNAKENNATNVAFNEINKNIKVNWNDQFSWWRVWILKCSTMTNHVFIFN